MSYKDGSIAFNSESLGKGRLQVETKYHGTSVNSTATYTVTFESGNGLVDEIFDFVMDYAKSNRISALTVVPRTTLGNSDGKRTTELKLMLNTNNGHSDVSIKDQMVKIGTALENEFFSTSKRKTVQLSGMLRE